MKYICEKIHLFQSLKEILIHNKVIKEACLKQLGRIKKDPHIVHVMGQLYVLMLGKLTILEYLDSSSLAMVEILIKWVTISNDLVELGATINVMTKYCMSQLSISKLSIVACW